MPLSSSRLTVRTTVSPLLLCKICRWVRMRFEGATLALGSRCERHQGRCLLLDTLAQDSHVFVFVQYFQVTPPGTLCDCFPLPLHVRFFVMIYTRFTFQFWQNLGSAPPQRIFMSFQLNRVMNGSTGDEAEKLPAQPGNEWVHR